MRVTNVLASVLSIASLTTGILGHANQHEDGYCGDHECHDLYLHGHDGSYGPPGETTAHIPRPHIGSVPYGSRIDSCTQPGVIALTFDDGPYHYTSDLLDLLDEYGAKATFFINGYNMGQSPMDDCSTGHPELLHRMLSSGHQLASHTWSHANLNTLSDWDFQNQIHYNEIAFRNIFGFFPTYMRPPYLACDSECFSSLSQLGYHVIYQDLDTFDWQNDSPDLIQISKDNFSGRFFGVGEKDVSIVLAHDIHHETVYTLARYMLETMRQNGFGTSVTVGACLGDDPANWYRQAGEAEVCPAHWH